MEIEQNIKYKNGRVETLALLRRQDKEHLAESIKRLLADKSEDCHMGAFELALELKKGDKRTFMKVLPDLQAMSNPTGREKVLLKELLGDRNETQDILKKPGYGLYDVNKDWVLPKVQLDASGADKLFVCGEAACINVLKKLDKLIDENRERVYKNAYGEEELLGNKLSFTQYGSEKGLINAYPFPEMWKTFYEQEIKTPQLLFEIQLYCQCYLDKENYEKNKKFYYEVFSFTFSNFLVIFSYWNHMTEIVYALFNQYVTQSQKIHFAFCVGVTLLSIIDPSNELLKNKEDHKDKRPLFLKGIWRLPIIKNTWQWLSAVGEKDWERSFALRFALQQNLQHVDCGIYYRNYWEHILKLSDYVQCYIRGIWDKDLFYKAVFTYCGIGVLLNPISIVARKGAVSLRSTKQYGLDDFFGDNVIKPVNGKYRFDMIGDEMPEMTFAHELYQEIIPLILKVELKRGEKPTLFSELIKNIHAVCGIDYMIQILTALGKDSLQCYYFTTDKRQILSRLLEVSMPKPEETAEDLRKALKGTDIKENRLVELAMFTRQWIPMIEDYLKMPGFESACYYFMAHTREVLSDQEISIITKYTSFSSEELQEGVFDIHWFFQVYNKLGEKNFNMVYDAAKYSSIGTAYGRARKYADAALGRVDKEELKAEINAKRNKDLLMSIGLLPLPEGHAAREEELLDRYQFLQKFKKESKQFGAQRRASEGRAVEIALRNLSINAGFTDVTRLILRMEGKLVEQSAEYFAWRTVDEIELMIVVDENGKSTLQCRKDGKLLKSIPTKYKKDNTIIQYQAVVKDLKEQYSRTKQMMEHAMEDRTAFEVWEFLELYNNPIVRPIIESLVVRTVEEQDIKIGFFTKEGIVNTLNEVLPAKMNDQIFVAHPFDLYKSGHWHDYQKFLFERKMKQPFKQVFRELYVKLDDELNKHYSMLFSGNQIRPQKTAGVLKERRWIADYENGLQKIYYKENIVSYIYAMTDWLSLSDVEAPTLERVVFSDCKTGQSLKIKDIPDIIYSEVMRDVDLAVSVAYVGGVDPETSSSTIEMRQAIITCNLDLFQIKNVHMTESHAIIDGKLGQYSVHLGSGVVHQIGNAMLFVIPIHSQQCGRIFLPFMDDDPKTAEIMSKILLFAEDTKIKDPRILQQIQ